jgi:hypothetical protein
MRLDRASRPSFRLAPLLALALLAGCATVGVPVTGQDSKDPTWTGSQSETAASVANFAAKKVIAIAFNDGTNADGKIQYTPTSRTVLPGASLMGWAYSEDDGASWKYGGSVKTSAEWPVLWGDPAITSSQRDQRYVFMSNLAVPASKMPANGATGYMGSYLGGACIARSTDGGKTFSLYQCVHDDFAFYDGGSMASSTTGDIYAAFVAPDSDRIDVWHAPGEDAQFARLPNPFPGCQMMTHPRIRVGYPTIALGSPNPSLFVAGQIAACDVGVLAKEQPGSYGQIIINRYHNGQWGTPRVISNTAERYPEVLLSDRKLRTGPQFSFDVGAASQNGNDHIRMLYTRRDSKNRLYVEGSMCKFDLSEPCAPAPEWGTTPGYYGYQGDQFNPNVRAFPGFLTIPPAWAGTFISRDKEPSGNTVIVRRGGLAVLPNGSRIMFTVTLADQGLVCPDNRGYWGDYDDLQFVGFVKDTTTARFLRPFTSSLAGCIERTQYTSTHVHVRSATFP